MIAPDIRPNLTQVCLTFRAHATMQVVNIPAVCDLKLPKPGGSTAVSHHGKGLLGDFVCGAAPPVPPHSQPSRSQQSHLHRFYNWPMMGVGAQGRMAHCGKANFGAPAGGSSEAEASKGTDNGSVGEGYM